MKARHPKGCVVCGRTETIETVDNFGQAMIGYPCHRLKTLAEVNAILAAGGYEPINWAAEPRSETARRDETMNTKKRG